MVQASVSSMPPWKILPACMVTYPLALKYFGRLTKSGWSSPNQVRLPSTPVWAGVRPLSIELRDGLQSGNWQ